MTVDAIRDGVFSKSCDFVVKCNLVRTADHRSSIQTPFTVNSWIGVRICDFHFEVIFVILLLNGYIWSHGYL